MKTSAGSNFISKRNHGDEIRLKLKEEWKRLWNDKYDDGKIAEGISTEEYSQLFVEQGQIIYATRNCKSLDFQEILEKKLGRECYENISPPPKVGGWRKFAKKSLPKKTSKRKKPKIKVDLNQQQRKNGRGWKNKIRINRKIRDCV